METLLRKYLWAVDLAVVALCAGITARATATMLESAMLAQDPSEGRMTEAPVSAPREAARGEQPARGKQIEEILRRNLFCWSCRPIAWPVSLPSTAPLVSAPGPGHGALPLRLLAIMYASPPADRRWSVAIIRDEDFGTAGPYAIGSRIRGASVDEIAETRVYLNVGGDRREQLDLLNPPISALKTEPRRPAIAPDPLTAELEAGIERTGEHRYRVQRSTVESLIGKMGALSPAARLVPEVRQGGPAGFRLLSVRADGPFASIGLLEGDLISTINGLDLTSPDNALAIYAKLRASDHVSVAVERNGRNITEEYDLR
jgi:general secretion pathway protein C